MGKAHVKYTKKTTRTYLRKKGTGKNKRCKACGRYM